MQRLIEKINEATEHRELFALCTVVQTKGSSPLKAGSKMLVWQDGKSFGTIGGGNIERQVIEDAIELMNENNSQLKEYNLLDQQMCCGGTMKIFIEPMKKINQLLIFGAGHIGRHIALFSEHLNFKALMIDERKEMLDSVSAPHIKRIFLNHREAFSQLTFDEKTFIVICTHLHEYDREILAHCISMAHSYLGMIGSERKVLITRKRFLQQNICTEEQLDKVDMPMGFDIGQNSPAEIALGIISKIVAVSNGKEFNQENKILHYEESVGDSNRCS